MFQDDTVQQIKTILKSIEVPLVIISIGFALSLIVFSVSKYREANEPFCRGSSKILTEYSTSYQCDENASPELVKEDGKTIVLCKCLKDNNKKAKP